MNRKKYRICLTIVLAVAVIAVVVYSMQMPSETNYKNSVLVQMEGGEECRKLYI